jgi:hypothetical protein
MKDAFYKMPGYEMDEVRKQFKEWVVGQCLDPYSMTQMPFVPSDISNLPDWEMT